MFDGTKAELRDVLDELATVAMFGGGKRLIVVEDAEDFISRLSGGLGRLYRPPQPQRRPGPGDRELAEQHAAFQGGGRRGAGDRLQRPAGGPVGPLAGRLVQAGPRRRAAGWRRRKCSSKPSVRNWD